MSGINRLLGICIPTYNRAQILKKNIDNLIIQVENFNIPIFISDNNSTDNTKEIVDNARIRYQHIYYSKNEFNIGSDLNFQKALMLSDTKYSWLLGDDDTIIKDFDKVYNILREDEYDALVFGPPKTKGKLSIYSDANSILIDLAGAMTWISGLIINQKIIKIMNFSRYAGSSFVHAGALLEALCKEDVKVYNYAMDMGNRVVDTMQKYYSGFSDIAFETFTCNWMSMICSLPFQYTYEAKLKAIANLPTAPFRTITLVLYRCWGAFNYEKLKKQRRIIISIGYSHYYKMLIISIMPKIFAKGIISLGAWIRKKKYGF